VKRQRCSDSGARLWRTIRAVLSRDGRPAPTPTPQRRALGPASRARRRPMAASSPPTADVTAAREATGRLLMQPSIPRGARPRNVVEWLKDQLQQEHWARPQEGRATSRGDWFENHRSQARPRERLGLAQGRAGSGNTGRGHWNVGRPVAVIGSTNVGRWRSSSVQAPRL
jgi:hypothetical protein